MGISDIERTTVITGDEARGGVTGHNVRYVLAFGLTGVILAFAAVWIYLGYDRVGAAISAALAVSPYDVMRALAPYATVMLAGAVAAGLMLGLLNLIGGRSANASQSWMRLRVIAQFAIICVIMAMFYISTSV